MAKSKEVNFLWTPKGPAQQIAKENWRNNRIFFFVGPAGGGKTHCALGLALSELMRSNTSKLFLSRPQITVDEKYGFVPGTLDQKTAIWFGPLHDVWSQMSGDEDWERLEKFLGKRMEMVPVGMLRGRTIKDGTLIIDEAQNLSYAQLVCALTRIGDSGRIIFTGDAQQSDRFTREESPLMDVCRRLKGLEEVAVVHFSAADQQRSELVNKVLERL